MMDWMNFTPQQSLLGGLLIGLATAMLWLLNGRIAGISGITAGVLISSGAERLWRLAFVLGLVLSSWVWLLLAPLPVSQVTSNYWLLAIAGVLVGFGARLGSGCTSGHGICGLSRLSGRSLVATVTFMTVAVITVFVVRHVV
jgi:hypothetical protein